MYLSYYTCVKRIFTLKLPERQETLSSEQALNLSHNHLVGKQTLTHLAKLTKMVEHSFRDPLPMRVFYTRMRHYKNTQSNTPRR